MIQTLLCYTYEYESYNETPFIIDGKVFDQLRAYLVQHEANKLPFGNFMVQLNPISLS